MRDVHCTGRLGHSACWLVKINQPSITLCNFADILLPRWAGNLYSVSPRNRQRRDVLHGH